MLSQKNVDINDRDFFKDTFTRAEIEELLQGRPASDMFNFRSPSFKQLGLEAEKLSDRYLLDRFIYMQHSTILSLPFLILKEIHLHGEAVVLLDLKVPARALPLQVALLQNKL